MKVRNLNPLPELPRRIGGTDLGIPFRAFGSAVGLVYGDTFGYSDDRNPQPAVGGPDWRSPVIAWTERVTDPKLPIKVTGAVKGGAQLWNYPHDNAEFSTVLPTDAIEIDGVIYVWVMVTKGLGNERWCELAISRDRGATWDNGPQFSTSKFGGRRVMMTFDRKPGSEWIDAFSTGGLARNKGILRWRVRPRDFRDSSKWEGWGYDGKNWRWTVNPTDNEVTEILPGSKFGEIGFRWIQGNAVLSGFDVGDYSIFLKVGANTDADWTRAKTYRPVTGNPRGVDIVPRLYGGFVHPDSTFAGGFILIVSEWAQSGNPYRAMQFWAGGIQPAGPIVFDSVEQWVPSPPPAPLPVPAPLPPKEIPMAEPTVTDIERVVGASETTTAYHVDNPGGPAKPVNLWGAVKAILFEITLWQRMRDRKTLTAQKDSPDTMYGMANRGASWGAVNNEDLAKILRNQQKIAAALKITDMEK